MSLNWREIDGVLEELPLEEGFIQKIRQPDFSSLVFDLFHQKERYPLYICLAQNQTRIHRLTRSVKNTVPLQRFAQLLRSKIKGARITAVAQLGEDRIIKMTLVRADVEQILWIRLWNNAANIILTDPDGTILDAFFRRPKKGEVSGGKFAPVLASGPGGKKEYPVRDFGGEGDLNRRIEEFYFGGQAAIVKASYTERIQKAGEKEVARLEATIEQARKQIHNEADIEHNRRIGDLLTSNLHKIEKGASWAEVENFYADNETIRIELDPRLTPEKNAERYYQTAKKQKGSHDRAVAEIEGLERDLKSIRDNLAEAGQTDDNEILKEIFEAITSGGKRVQRTADKSIPGLQFQSGPFTLLLGRTSKENDLLLRHHVRGNDYWLHARDFPGAYVFIKSKKGKSVPLEVLLDAGNLALHYSKAKAGGGGDLFYTQVKYLRRAKGGKQGLVIPTQEKNLSVRVEQPRLDRLLGKNS